MTRDDALQRLHEELVLRGARPRTRIADLGYAKRDLAFCDEHRLGPDRTQGARRFLLHLREERKLSASSVKVAYSALRGLFEAGFERAWNGGAIPSCRRRRNLPVTLIDALTPLAEELGQGR